MMREKKKWKSLLSIFLSLILTFSLLSVTDVTKVLAESTTVKVKVSKNIAQRGDIIDVSMYVPEDGELEAFTSSIVYDADKLEYISSEQGENMPVGTTIINPTSGKVQLTALSLSGYIKGGLGMTVHLKVKDNAEGKASIGVAGVDFGGVFPDTYSISGPDGISFDGVTIRIPLTGISLNTSSLTLAKGESSTLLISPVPGDATVGEVSWSSDNNDIVTVNNGVVTAVGIGTTVVTASVGELSASCNVTVTNPLTGISLNKTDLALKKGTSEKLIVNYQPADADGEKTVQWTSSQPDVAQVDMSGNVTALKDGTAIITAIVGAFSTSCTVTVQEVKLQSISFGQDTVTVHRGDNAQLEIIYNPENTTDDKSAVWKSSDESVAVVDAAGKVTAQGIGNAIITATVSGITASCTIIVDAPLTGIHLEKSELELIKNQSEQIEYMFNPEDTTDSKEVSFVSSDESVAFVTQEGLVTALKEGTAQITITGANNVTAIVTVNVKEIPVTGVILNYTNANVEKDQTLQLTAQIQPDNTTDSTVITWSSSDETVATVDENGLVTARGGGKADIIATAANGTTAVCTINVPIHMTGITLPTVVELLKGNTVTLQPEFEPENTTDDKTVTWTSDNPEVATVNENGMVFGVKEGTANVTATAGTITATTIVTIKEIHLTGIEIKMESTDLLKGQLIDLKKYLVYQPENTTDSKIAVWSSSDEEIASVDANGVLKAVKEGTVAITATVGEYSDTVEINIKGIPLESIVFDKVVDTMEIGEKIQLGVLYNPENTTDDIEIEWMTSDNTIISVENGLISAIKAGKAIITAKVGEITVSKEITVNEKKDTSAGTVITDNQNPSATSGTDVKDNGNKNSSKTDQDKQTNTSDKVKTGDTTNVLYYIILLFAALDIMGILAIVRRRKFYR